MPASGGEPGKVGVLRLRGGLAGGWRRRTTPGAGTGEQLPCLRATRAKYPTVSSQPRRYLWRQRRGRGQHRGQPHG